MGQRLLRKISNAVARVSRVRLKEDVRARLAKNFDEPYYLSCNPDVLLSGHDALEHYILYGWQENRRPNRWFNPEEYRTLHPEARYFWIDPFLHYLKHRRSEERGDLINAAEAETLWRFSPAGPLGVLVKDAKRLDPMVALPNTPRKMTSPLTAVKASTDVLEKIRREFSGKSYRYIIAVPHIRMSGASRVASIFADALAKACDPSEILVVTTDSSENEFIGWFSDRLELFDLSKELKNLSPDEKSKALIDVMRGIDCQTLINVNSRLVWDTLRDYGRQLHREFNIVTYLFTWDENANGDRVGYPIQWLRDTANFHHVLLTDTKHLAQDVSERLGFGQFPEDAQILPLYTPIAKNKAAIAQFKRNSDGHFLWAGRFDPQKRLDILVKIARANPKMIFDVYGKTILGTKDLAAYDPPDNIVQKGTYSDLQEVLDTPYSGFLYTAQWDGLPTILLDMAAAGLPIVAPNVGGISEMLDNSTGWLVEDFEDVDGYSAALAEMANDFSEARRRAEKLQSRLVQQFKPEDYVECVKNIVAKNEL